jgi:hypothetical protein
MANRSLKSGGRAAARGVRFDRGLCARIEQWTNRATGDVHSRSITSENVTSIYGRTAESRISDPEDPSRYFRWPICKSYDDTGNAIAFEYKCENSDGVEVAAAHEAKRSERYRSMTWI